MKAERSCIAGLWYLSLPKIDTYGPLRLAYSQESSPLGTAGRSVWQSLFLGQIPYWEKDHIREAAMQMSMTKYEQSVLNDMRGLPENQTETG